MGKEGRERVRKMGGAIKFIYDYLGDRGNFIGWEEWEIWGFGLGC